MTMTSTTASFFHRITVPTIRLLSQRCPLSHPSICFISSPPRLPSSPLINSIPPSLHHSLPIITHPPTHQPLLLFHSTTHTPISTNNTHHPPTNSIRLSKLLSSPGYNHQLSRRSAELVIQNGHITVCGVPILNPCQYIAPSEFHAIKIKGKLLIRATETHTRTRVWLVHKLKGEIVSEIDNIEGRDSMMERLRRAGVGKSKKSQAHLKPIGRLDVSTEGLLIFTNDGSYAHDMETPANNVHRSYRVRIHGTVTNAKLQSLRRGMELEEYGVKTRYKGMRVTVELTGRKTKDGPTYTYAKKGGSSNTWLKITCTEGKNRQIRKLLAQLKLKVMRLIRISYGDYELQTIPPGMALEVTAKSLNDQKKKGVFWETSVKNKRKKEAQEMSRNNGASVEWISAMDSLR